MYGFDIGKEDVLTYNKVGGQSTGGQNEDRGVAKGR